MNIIKIRRYFHQYPELSFEEYNTQKFIINYFKKEYATIYQINQSTLIYFDNKKDQTIAFRAEEDALPIIEENNLSYKSKNKEIMHACGHDGHMAILLKLGDYINKHKDLKYNYLLVFESGEEVSSGAKMIVNSPIYQAIKPKYVYALHLFPGLKEGLIYSKKGYLFAKCIEIDLVVFGKEGHLNNRDKSEDANYLMIKIMNKLYQYLDKIKNIKYGFGKIDGGKVRNVIANRCEIKGSIRVFSNQKYLKIKNNIISLIEKITFNYHLSFNDDFKPIINSSYLINKVKEKYPVNQCDKYYLGEDFPEYDKCSKCCYFLLGINSSPLHSATFNFNEDVLNVGLNFFISLLNI